MTRMLLSLVALVVVFGVALAACRSHRISSCVDRGGTPDALPWWQDPADVRCHGENR